MKDILNKLSSYNLFNYLSPGVIFAALAEYLTQFKFIHDNIIISFFIFYLIGLTISRIGSLIIEPFLKWLSFIQFSEYSDYVTASRSDPLLETLSEANNSYRTYCSLFLLLLLLKGSEKLVINYGIINTLTPYLLLIGLFSLFLFSYRKQNRYINKRVKETSDKVN